jgi:hypothetical protein
MVNVMASDQPAQTRKAFPAQYYFPNAVLPFPGFSKCFAARSLDTRMCWKAACCSSVSSSASNPKTCPIGLDLSQPPPRKIQELFLLELRLVCGDVRTIELDEPMDLAIFSTT